MICYWCGKDIKDDSGTGLYYHSPGFNIEERIIHYLCRKCALEPDVAKVFIDAGVFNNED